MFELRSLAHVSNWRTVLLDEPMPPEWFRQLPEFLKETAHEFLDSPSTELTAVATAALNRWYASSTGQATLAGFARALWSQMEYYGAHAMPGHDARHAMYKVPAASLQYVAAEGVEGWERVGVLGALLHDHGRWPEERLFGFPASSVLHARLSFLLGRELLESFEMPDPIKRHILLAAIRHTTGASPADPMPLKLTVAADRDQLYGPEIILRMAHHGIDADGAGSSYFGERPGVTVLDRLERFLTHRLPGPLFSREAHVSQLWQVLATFLLIAEEAGPSRRRFDRIKVARRAASAPWKDFSWEVAFAAARSHLTPFRCPFEALNSLLDAPHTQPAAVYRVEAASKLDLISAPNAARLGAALHHAHTARMAFDADEAAALRRIMLSHGDDALMGVLCGLVQDHSQPATESVSLRLLA
jgi:hypothetical protein